MVLYKFFTKCSTSRILVLLVISIVILFLTFDARNKSSLVAVSADVIEARPGHSALLHASKEAASLDLRLFADKQALQKPADGQALQKPADRQVPEKPADKQTLQKPADRQVPIKLADKQPAQKRADNQAPERSAMFDRQMVARSANLMKVKEVDCKALFADSRIDIEKAKTITRDVGLPALNETHYINLTSNCKRFQTDRGYIMSSLTKEEEEFPLAFSLLVFKEPEIVERLLRAIYRPQNSYCIHIDQKATDHFYKAMQSLAKCFPNVIIASRRIDVQWATFTVLEPELLCMEELWRFPKWKYFFTMTGQEFPLKTNHELVKILTAYDGANDLEGTVKRANFDRWRSQAPFGIRPIKGSVHITVNRDFVSYILHNNTAKVLLEWVKRDTSFPDETFFATLNHNPQLGIRGTYKGEPETDEERKPFLTRFKNWGHLPCASGNYVRAICILTLGDLPQLGQAKQYFANKFYLSEDRAVIGCLEEKIFNDTRDEYLGLKTFDVSYYAGLEFVKNKV